MATINSLNSSQYYSLLGQSQSGASKNGQTNTAALLGALGSKSSSTATDVTTQLAESGAYELSLSPQAQAYLASLNNGTASAGTATEDEGIRLSTQQFQQVKDILTKYQDAPFTQETFNQIQDDLEAAGLSGEKLAVQQQMNSFNPTATLLGVLNGSTEAPAVQQPSEILASIQSKSESYMQKIESLWKAMSSTAPTESA